MYISIITQQKGTNGGFKLKRARKRKVEEIIDGLRCPEGFECYKSFDVLCKAEDIGLGSYLLCINSKSKKCLFAVPFGNGYFCKCPLRVYIAKEFKK